MEKRLFVDVHVLQTVPPSCVNRDDTGSPKTAVYGGVIRARVSSQSWKKAVRTMFQDLFPKNLLGIRTKKIVGMVAEAIEQYGNSHDSITRAENILKNAGLNIKSAEKGTDALFFLSVAQAKALAKLAHENPDAISESPERATKNLIKEALKNAPGIDIALFGRMVADDPSYNTDACSQIAHAISTHKVNNEFDYFTAVDDISVEDNAGAGHIGTVEFNSSTLYRYATVAVHQLDQTLQTDTAKAVSGFIKAFVLSMPTGKQNTFANRTLPDAILVTLREDQPINLVGAFEKPVFNAGEGYVIESAKAFVRHTKNTYKNFVKEPIESYSTGELFSELSPTIQFSQLLENVEEKIARILGEEEES